MLLKTIKFITGKIFVEEKMWLVINLKSISFRVGESEMFVSKSIKWNEQMQIKCAACFPAFHLRLNRVCQGHWLL